MFDGESRYVDVGSLRLHYRVRGPRSARPLVLLHGIMGNAWEWDTAIDALVPGFRVYAVEQRGHGRSDWVGPYRAGRMGEDAAAFVRALDLWGVTLVGHSMGGLAGTFAVANHPARFDRLVVIDIGPRSLESDTAAGLEAALRHFARAAYATPDEALGEWLAGDELARADLMRHYVENGLERGADGLYRWRYDAAGLVEFVRDGFTAETVEGALARVRVPTLVVRGERSRALTRDEARRVASLLERGALVEIPAAGHDIGVQQPEAVAAAVLRFADAATRVPEPAVTSG